MIPWHLCALLVGWGTYLFRVDLTCTVTDVIYWAWAILGTIVTIL